MTSKIEQQVMGSVAAIYTVRQLTSRTALSFYALVLSVLVLGRLVWVSKIFQNFWGVEQHGVASTANYVLYALTHTHLAVQLTLVIAAVAIVSLLVDTVKSFSYSQRLVA